MFKGSMVAIITPFNEKGEIDKKAFLELIDWHLFCKTDAIVCSGTTGESPTLTDEEKLTLFKLAVDRSKGRCQVIAGTGTYNTKKSLEMTKRAKKIGVDGCLIVVPYYSRPTQEGCLAHYQEIAKANLPIIVYYHPGRTGVRLQMETFQKMEKIKNVVAIKEASADINFFYELIGKISLPILCGDDQLTVLMMEKGAHGVISVAANVIPKEWKELVDLCSEKKFDLAKERLKDYEEILKALFIETNPHGIKYALSVLGKCKLSYRLPLIVPREETQARIKEELDKLLAVKI